MSILRAISLWLLVLAIPFQTWASMAMLLHCKEVQVQASKSQAAEPHDHAAMMQQMASAASEEHGQHAHHTMGYEAGGAEPQASISAEPEGAAKALGCDCGCDCSGNCAMTCTAAVVPLFGSSTQIAFDAALLNTVSRPNKAQPAHRFTPLRPPSAAAS